jgi:hypoxanthine phosphoribosyltransferase
MTMREAEELSHDLASEIEAYGKPDLVVGLANGALLPTKIVAEHLQAPFQIVHLRRRGSRYKQALFAVMKALRIPNSILTFGPVYAILSRIQKRYEDLEHSDSAFGFDLAGKYVVLVDDAVHTGQTARHAKEQLLLGGASRVRIAVMCWYRGEDDSGSWEPDIHLHKNPHFYPWSNNSPFLKEFMAWLPANNLHFWR